MASRSDVQKLISSISREPFNYKLRKTLLPVYHTYILSYIFENITFTAVLGFCSHKIGPNASELNFCSNFYRCKPYPFGLLDYMRSLVAELNHNISDDLLVTISKKLIICSEEAIMMIKAIIFNSNEVIDKLLNNQYPEDIDQENPDWDRFNKDTSEFASNVKKLGRSIKDFDDNIWFSYVSDVAIHILYQKFTNITDHHKFISNDLNMILVEASEYDNIWAIGKKNDNSINQLEYTEWNGTNILGYSTLLIFLHLKGINPYANMTILELCNMVRISHNKITKRLSMIPVPKESTLLSK